MTTLPLLIETLNRPQLDALIERVTGETRGKSNSKGAAVKALHRVMGAQMMHPDEVVAVASDMRLTDYAAPAVATEECWPDDPSQDEAYFAHCERMEAEHAGEPEDLDKPPLPVAVAIATPNGERKADVLLRLALRSEGVTHAEGCSAIGWRQCRPYLIKTIERAGYRAETRKKGRDNKFTTIHAVASV